MEMKFKIVKLGMITEDGVHLERVVYSNGDIQWKNKSTCEEVEGQEAVDLEYAFKLKLLPKLMSESIGKHLLR